MQKSKFWTFVIGLSHLKMKQSETEIYLLKRLYSIYFVILFLGCSLFIGCETSSSSSSEDMMTQGGQIGGSTMSGEGMGGTQTGGSTLGGVQIEGGVMGGENVGGSY